mgnify:CR=1 FL=1
MWESRASDAGCMRGGMLGGAWQGAGGGAVRGVGKDAPATAQFTCASDRPRVCVGRSSPNTSLGGETSGLACAKYRNPRKPYRRSERHRCITKNVIPDQSYFLSFEGGDLARVVYLLGYIVATTRATTRATPSVRPGYARSRTQTHANAHKRRTGTISQGTMRV